jgi:hypothetical protein
MKYSGVVKYVQFICLSLFQVTLPASEDTLYWCKIFKLPSVRRKHHMVRVSSYIKSITWLE